MQSGISLVLEAIAAQENFLLFNICNYELTLVLGKYTTSLKIM